MHFLQIAIILKRMSKIILSSQGFQKNKTLRNMLLSVLPKVSNTLSVAIITTASAEWKEKNKHAIAAKQELEDMGFKLAQFIDIEFENPTLLQTFDVIYINGGNPFYLLYHLKKSGADKIIAQLADQGVVIVGISAGGVVLDPNINIVDYFDKGMNTVNLKNLTGLNIIPTVIYPHYTIDVEEKIQQFEKQYQCTVNRLTDDQSLILESKE